MGSDCDKLDTYLLGDLSGDEVSRFEEHLSACAACRAAVDEQQWLDGLLQSPVRLELERVPDAIVRSIQMAVVRRRRQRRVAVGGLAVAAALVVAAGWTVWAGLRPQNPPAGQVAQSEGISTGGQETGGSSATRPQPPDARPQPPEGITKAVVVGDENTIVVPVESRYPNVTVVRVYPEYQPKHVTQTQPGRPADGRELDRPQTINGG